MSLLVNYLYEFGEFRLNVQERVLKQGDKTVSLTPKAFELLCVFIENHGRLISKEELMEKLWAGSFVEESNLTFNIRQLRKALGDDAQTPRFIETVRLHGYRFIADVKEKLENCFSNPETVFPVSGLSGKFDTVDSQNNGPKIDSLVQSSLQNPPRQFLSARFIIPLIVFGLIASFSISAIWRTSVKKRNSAVPILNADFKSENLSITGSIRQAVISPDGKQMVYSNIIGSKQSLWIRQLETNEDFQLVQNSDDDYLGLNLSTDGETIYFVRSFDSAPGILYRISKFGGIPKQIVSGVQGGFGLSQDNRQISFVRCEYRDVDFCSLFVSDINGQNERKIMTRPRPIRIGDSQFSPDGLSLAVAVGQSRNASKDFALVKVDLKTGQESLISEQKFFNIKYMKWLPDQSGLLFSAFDHFYTPSQIYEVSLVDGRVKQITNDSQPYNRISFDQDFTKMIATRSTPNFRLWLGSTDNPATVTPWCSAQTGFDLAHSGAIYYSSLTNGSNNIWMITADGSNQRQLTFNEGSNTNPIISPDEKFVYFSSNRSGSKQVWRMNPDGSDQIQLSEGEGGHPLFITADGQTIYYLTALNHNLAKIDFQKDGTFSSKIVSNERMWHAELDPTGKTIAFFPQKKGKSMINLMSIKDYRILKNFTLFDSGFMPTELRWSADGQQIYYQGRHKSLSAIWKLSLETGRSEKFLDLGSEETAAFFDLSADGKTFAFVRGRWLHDAILVEGLN